MKDVTDIPNGWSHVDFKAKGWTADFVSDAALAVWKDGNTWVAMTKTGLTTMQGCPIGPEHLQAASYLRETLGLNKGNITHHHPQCDCWECYGFN